ncbi:glycosyltransferase family 2 protein [Alkalicoccobacillus porphyridii]|uniref:Glycosyltransferase family 2 protein n=1 Tax=Alkalicoccobacillus porphyridii TaxID=2597270 RepID=A0A554A3U8_9BACI|nr:glycosyltransferase family 2 protein [Alkalicoccobacillus porphyridii]TSB48371.1 glycosyltransferase family 2 protein [Alkalicoccobacillus porphyridii]
MLSIIIPTLGQRVEEFRRLCKSLEEQTNQSFEVIVTSQDHHKKVGELLQTFSFSYQHVTLHRRGLSYARNEGLKMIKGDYVTFSDDDCWYPSDMVERVERFFLDHQKPVVCFQIYDPISQQSYKNYPLQKKDSVSTKDLFRKSSIEIFVHVTNVDKRYLRFDERFGLGAEHPSGEENIFLVGLKRAGYEISYIPVPIVYHLKPTHESRLAEKTMISKGALFAVLYNKPIDMLMLTVLFAKKIPHLKRPFSTYIKAVRLALQIEKK